MATPYACTHLVEVDSTQDEARVRFDGTPHLVVAERQRHARGRFGRLWDQAPRALAASLALRPAWPQDTWPRITLVSGLAALDVLPGELKLRWPNDLYRSDRKAGGILVEASGSVVVVGLGVNLWWPDAPPDRVALYSRDPGSDAAHDLASAWAESLLRRLASTPDDWGRSEAERTSATLGQRVALPDGVEATAVGIDDDGALVVESEGQRWSVGSGPVAVIGDGRGEL